MITNLRGKKRQEKRKIAGHFLAPIEIQKS